MDAASSAAADRRRCPTTACPTAAILLPERLLDQVKEALSPGDVALDAVHHAALRMDRLGRILHAVKIDGAGDFVDVRDDVVFDLHPTVSHLSVLSLADRSQVQLLPPVPLHRAEAVMLRRIRAQRCKLASAGMTWVHKRITGLYRHVTCADDHKVQQQPGLCLRAALPPSISQRCNGAVAMEICVGPDYLWC